MEECSICIDGWKPANRIWRRLGGRGYPCESCRMVLGLSRRGPHQYIRSSFGSLAAAGKVRMCTPNVMETVGIRYRLDRSIDCKHFFSTPIFCYGVRRALSHPEGVHSLIITHSAITADTSNIRKPTIICLLGLSLALMPAFVAWVDRQEHSNRPALIPNSLWSNKVFTSICINVFLMWGAFNAFEQIVNLFFQEVQGLDALETALRFLPMPLSGLLANLVVGLVVHRIRADWIVLTTTVVSCVSPLMMALISASWSYWVAAFPAVFLNATGADSLFTISNLLIMSVFPGSTQGLAGGVFNTIAQIGKSLSLALVALLAESITKHSTVEEKKSPEALMEGYRAAFWFMFALSAASLSVSLWGLHGIGRVGREVVA